MLTLEQIIEMDKTYFMNTYGPRTRVCFSHGVGLNLYSTDGKVYKDFLGGIAVNVLGHAHPGLTSALKDQIDKFLHCSSIYYIESQAKLAEKLGKYSDGCKVFFCSTGAEANEGAIKLVRKFFYKKGQSKYKVITTLDSFHGRTLATVAATGQPQYQKPYKPLPTGFVNVPYNDLSAMEEAIDEYTAAVMVEIIQGESGIMEADIDYIKGLRKLCDDKGILLIFDEVQTAIGRLGTIFGWQSIGVKPDIFTLAKALGGGVPIGALLAKSEVADAFEPGDHGTTFGGNPLSCRAGLAVIEAIEDENLLEKCIKTGTYFKNKLIGLKDKYDFITKVKGRGLMLGIEIDSSIDGKPLAAKAFDAGYLIHCAGHNTLRFMPPLNVSSREIDDLINVLDDIFKTVKF